MAFEDDADLRSFYLGLVRTGTLRFAAARQCGTTAKAVQLFTANHPDFSEALDEAEGEAAEPIEVAVYEAATEGDEWAVKLWLSRRQKERWGEPKAQATTNVLIVGADDLAELQRKLESRQLQLGSGRIIDIEEQD